MRMSIKTKLWNFGRTILKSFVLICVLCASQSASAKTLMEIEPNGCLSEEDSIFHPYS